MKTKTTKKKKYTRKDAVAVGSKSPTRVLENPYIEEIYSASIKIFGKVYTSSGASVKECVENLQVGKVGGVCVMTITHGENKREKILNAGQLFRLFSSSRIMHEMAIKNVVNMFGDL